MTGSPIYVLGHDADELARLARQSEWFAPATRDVLDRGGVRLGMRVIDVGCGAGDVSLLLATMVGPAGQVHAVDRAAEAVATTRKRAAAAGLSQVHVHQCALDALEVDPVDAAVGRFVLMHQADPAATLRHIARLVAPGGRVVMIESHLDALAPAWQSLPPSAAFATLVDVVRRTIRAAGGRTDMGLRLREAFLDAGLPDPAVVMHTPLAGSVLRAGCTFWCDSLRSMAPTAERLGVAALTRADIDALERAIAAELDVNGAVLALPPVVTAWCATS